jgi:hypothetical protein
MSSRSRGALPPTTELTVGAAVADVEFVESLLVEPLLVESVVDTVLVDAASASGLDPAAVVVADTPDVVVGCEPSAAGFVNDATSGFAELEQAVTTSAMTAAVAHRVGELCCM